MPKTLEDVIAGLPAIERDAVERGSRELIAEAHSLADLRRDLNMTQSELAGALATSQANVAKTERKRDMKLSTARKIVEALGGRLVVFADLPGRGRVQLDLAGRDSVDAPTAGSG